MKTLLKSPLFYTNLLLAALVVILGANTPAVYAGVTNFVKRALAAAPVTGSGTINFLARFAGAANPSSEIGDSIIYDDGAGRVGIGTGSAILDSKLEIQAGIDRMLELTRTGAPAATVIRQGTDGALVVNNGGLDALTIKNGNIGIGGAVDSAVKLYVGGGARISDRLAIGTEIGTGNTRFVAEGNASLPTPGAFLYINGKLYLQEQSSDPASPINGMIWMRF